MEPVQVVCVRCGSLAPDASSDQEAREEAVEQGFQLRRDGWICPECATAEPYFDR